MKTKMAKTSAIKKDKVNTIPTAEKTTKTAKFTTNNKVSSVGVTSRRKKKTMTSGSMRHLISTLMKLLRLRRKIDRSLKVK